MEDGKKAAVVVGVGAGIAGLLYLATKVKAAPPPPEAAAIRIEILDAEGNPVAHNSPAELIEGESYTVRVTVTNRSTKAGMPWEATLEIVVQAATEWTTLIPVTATMQDFGAGQTRSFDYPMSVPVGTGGETGQIIALVNDPAGVELARAREDITIISIEIIYGATVTIGV